MWGFLKESFGNFLSFKSRYENFTRLSEIRYLIAQTDLSRQEIADLKVRTLVGETPFGNPFEHLAKAAKYFNWKYQLLEVNLKNLTNQGTYYNIDVDDDKLEFDDSGPVLVRYKGFSFLAGTFGGQESGPSFGNSLLVYSQGASESLINEFYKKIIEYLVIDYKNKPYFKMVGGGQVKKFQRIPAEVFLPSGVRDIIISKAKKFFSPEVAEVYLRNNEPYKSSFLFVGGPGNGKTLMVELLVSELNLPLVGLSLSETNAYGVEKAFRLVKMLASNGGAVLVIDDSINALTRQGYSHSDKLLRILGGVYNWSIENPILIVATGNADKIDQNDPLYRDERFGDNIYQFNYDKKSGEAYYNYLLKKYKVQEVGSFADYDFFRMTEIKQHFKDLLLGKTIDSNKFKKRRLGLV